MLQKNTFGRDHKELQNVPEEFKRIFTTDAPQHEVTAYSGGVLSALMLTLAIVIPDALFEKLLVLYAFVEGCSFVLWVGGVRKAYTFLTFILEYVTGSKHHRGRMEQGVDKELGRRKPSPPKFRCTDEWRVRDLPPASEQEE